MSTSYLTASQQKKVKNEQMTLPAVIHLIRTDFPELNRLKGNKLAATYSRGTYRTTTIGKGVFDGRVRDGIGSGHTFMATKNWMSKDRLPWSVRTDGQADDSLKTTHRERGQGDGRTRTF